ncbi:F-box only protein 27-like [Hippopotamus amphibius kiboko]|uniref:F-box only protein 27-like n=1 Tax=Hippopotamus amphibius kiboko TaxID=575201 RepID=UPI0025934FC6|nr:F-box only protein 27-like [Hippopotamus amphibius kiboko]
MAHQAGALAEMPVAAGPDEETTCASASGGLSARVPAPDLEAEETLGLGQLPVELLEMVLVHVPPHMLLGHCRSVCRHWRDLVDCQHLWLSILDRDHASLSPILRTYLPPEDSDPRPCVLGRFCERRPIGRDLLSNPNGEGGEPRKGVLLEQVEGCCYKGEMLNLEKEGLWPELLDSGKIDICVSACWKELQDSDHTYHLVIGLLDANHDVLHRFFHEGFPIQRRRNRVSFKVRHVFSNLKKGVRFVFFDHSVWGLDYWLEQYVLSMSESKVIVRFRLS